MPSPRPRSAEAPLRRCATPTGDKEIGAMLHELHHSTCLEGVPAVGQRRYQVVSRMHPCCQPTYTPSQVDQMSCSMLPVLPCYVCGRSWYYGAGPRGPCLRVCQAPITIQTSRPRHDGTGTLEGTTGARPIRPRGPDECRSCRVCREHVILIWNGKE